MRAEADQVAAMAMRFVERCGAMTIDRVPTAITMVQGTIPNHCQRVEVRGCTARSGFAWRILRTRSGPCSG